MKHGVSVSPRYSVIARLSGICLVSLVITVIVVLLAWNVLVFLKKSGFNFSRYTAPLKMGQDQIYMFSGRGGDTSGERDRAFDPNELRLFITKGAEGYTLIDIRPEKDYKIGHIKGAIQTDISKMSFKKDLKIIVYGHSAYDGNAKKATNVLLKQGVDAYYLAIGWNEWRHFRNLWLPQSEWNTNDLDRTIEETDKF